MSVVIIYILFNIYASLSGIKDAILYGERGSNTFIFNEHRFFVMERAIVLTIIIASTFITIQYALILTLINALSFSFWHNGFYYETKGRIFKSDIHWFSDSTSSTARIEINYIGRTILFIISIILLILTLIYKPN